MNNDREQFKEDLLMRFRDYLETDFLLESTDDTTDQMSLFRELAGLRNEVRIESRQFKGALDDFRQAFSSLDNSQNDIAKRMQAKEQQEKQAGRAILEPFISGLIDLYDRVAAGLETQPPSPSLTERLFPGGRQVRNFLEGHLEGQSTILGRILALLESCGISAIKAEQEPFDPKIMQAVGFMAVPQQTNNIVLQENRKGFRQGERIVRPSDVVVNKYEV